MNSRIVERLAASAAAVVMAFAATVWGGPDHIEEGDAGSLPTGAQRTTGNGALQFISGSLDGLAFVGGDFEDMYVIAIPEGGMCTFSATTLVPGSTQFDSRLYLFQVSGLGLLGNDNGDGGPGAAGTGGFVGACCLPDDSCIDEVSAGLCEKKGGDYAGDFSSCTETLCPLQGGSTLTNASTDGTGIVVTEPGEYLLAITVAPREPFSGSGSIFLFETSTEVSGPDGDGGGGAVIGWTSLSCGSPEAGDCFEPHEDPFCNQTFCCELVCESEPLCCQESWDSSCVGLAKSICLGQGFGPPPGGTGPGDYIIALNCVTFSDPPSGACCAGDGSCQFIPQTECMQQGGVYQGDDIACVNPDGTPVCVECLTNDDCDPCEMCVDGECVSAERTLIIKQGACPAPVSSKSNGVVSMALIGEAGFAAHAAVPSSLELRRCDGEGGVAVPLAGTLKAKDINHPYDGAVGCGGCACNPNQSSDGIADLQMKFKTGDLISALDLGGESGVVALELSGVLADGTPFCAHDCVALRR